MASRLTVSVSSSVRPSRSPGSHAVTISLYREISATVTVLVGVSAEEEVEEDEEAAEAAEVAADAEVAAE